MFNLENFDHITLSQSVNEASFKNKRYKYCTIEVKTYNRGQEWSVSLHGNDTKGYMRRKRITYKNNISYEEAENWLKEIKVEIL